MDKDRGSPTIQFCKDRVIERVSQIQPFAVCIQAHALEVQLVEAILLRSESLRQQEFSQVRNSEIRRHGKRSDLRLFPQVMH